MAKLAKSNVPWVECGPSKHNTLCGELSLKASRVCASYPQRGCWTASLGTRFPCWEGHIMLLIGDKLKTKTTNHQLSGLPVPFCGHTGKQLEGGG